MSESTQPDVYFTKHLLRTGLQCPTRLFYKSLNYPENREALPFIAHYRYNKRQLKKLAKCSYPKGIQIVASSIEQAHKKTIECLTSKEAVLFDPVFIYDRFMAKVPILEKKGNVINVYHIQTKAFRPKKHTISNSYGRIHSKWLNYITDFAFQVHVIDKCYPEWKINPFLVLPAKYAESKTDNIHELLKRIKKGEIRAETTVLNDENLLVYLDVSNEIEQIFSGRSLDGELFEGMTLEAVLSLLADHFYSKERYPVSVGKKCKNCEFRIEQERVKDEVQSGFNECWNSALSVELEKKRKPLVFGLIGPGTNHWIKRGIYFQEDVPEGEFYELETIQNLRGRINEKQRQSLQIIQAKGQPVPEELLKANLFKELERWEYPIHFLDFEAGNYVVPTRKGRKPYHLLVFQFSCHTLYPDGSWGHSEWIDELDGSYPNYEMVRRLKKVPQITEGTIVQYSNFERNALKTIRKELMEEEQVQDAEELTEWLDQIISRHDSSHKFGPYLADLSRLVKHFYYNYKMEDSLSIKDVLQSVLTISPRLKELYSRPYNSSNFNSFIWWQADSAGDAQSPYRLMLNEQEQGIRRGTEAMVVYARLLSEDLNKQEQKACKKALLRYCEVDTLAMLMIYQHWNHLM